MYQLHTFDIDWRTSPKPGTHFTMVLSFFHDRVGFILNPKRGTFELPGGHVEVWDANWEATSVREYAEEVGVLPVQDIDYAFSVENIDRAEKTSSYCHVFLHKTNVPEGNLQYFQSIPENTSFPREVYEQIILS